MAYLACARRLLAAPGEIYPQFATHNAHTLAAVHQMARPARWQPGQYEFQCLHGMGEPLYEQVVGAEEEGGLGRPCRVYAPVGSHRTLLAYLVRRLLENGANTSFVNRIADRSVSIEALIADPVAAVEARDGGGGGRPGQPHPAIPLPAALYGAARPNSQGIDLADDARLAELGHELRAAASQVREAAPLLAGDGHGAAARAMAPAPTDEPADAQAPAESRAGAGTDAGPSAAGMRPGAAPVAEADIGAGADVESNAGTGTGAGADAHADAAGTGASAGEPRLVRNPADRRDIVGSVREATAAEVADALGRRRGRLSRLAGDARRRARRDAGTSRRLAAGARWRRWPA